MTWRDLPAEVRTAAESVLTLKQLDVWKLELAGCGAGRTAVMLGVSRATIREHRRVLHTQLYEHGIMQDTSGDYYLERAA